MPGNFAVRRRSARASLPTAFRDGPTQQRLRSPRRAFRWANPIVREEERFPRPVPAHNHDAQMATTHPIPTGVELAVSIATLSFVSARRLCRRRARIVKSGGF